MKQIARYTIILSLSFLFTNCHKEITGLSANANEIFWVTNNGSDMPVRVMGNTLSKVIIVIVHGGPGDGSYDYADYKTERLRQKYAVAFWDQRNAGSAAGNNNMSKLSLPQMINDLEAVVKVLKLRYQAADVFLYAHSFGGLLASGYLVKDSNQAQLKGWIEIDGAHNYPLSNSSSSKMLMDTALSEINKGHNVPQWQSIFNYCSTHDPVSSFETSSRIESYARDAEDYMGIKRHNSIISLAEDPSDELVNFYNLYYTTAGNDFLQSLQTANFSDQLYRIKIPSLLLWGQFDFTVPPDVGEDALANLGSAYKKLVMFPNSGHHPMETDTDMVEDEIINFVEIFK